MAILQPYLTFSGNCREALEFYNQAIGGELKIMTFGESPMAAETPAEEHNRVMHATIIRNDFHLMASDCMAGQTMTHGSSISLSINCGTDEIDPLFNKLSEGGTINMPMQDTFWGARFGQFVDKFGMPWMLNSEHKK